MLTALIGFLILFAVAFLGYPLGLTMLLVGFVGVGVLRGWEPALEASGSDWMIPILAVLLDDPYPAVRHLAANSLRARPGFESFEFDYIAAETARSGGRADALARFAGLEPPADHAPREPVLLKGPGQVNWARVERYLGQRDDRFVFRQE